MKNSSVLITGASTGIGEVYADRFAKKGHNLVLVARNKIQLENVAKRLTQEYGVSVEILPADLTLQDDLMRIENYLRTHSKVKILVNNAGMGQGGNFISQTPEKIEQLIMLNITALTRLAHAIAPKLIEAGKGAIINLGSVVSLAPELNMSLYGASKAFVLFLSQGLDIELSPKGIYVQAVLPAATYTNLWTKAGFNSADASTMMNVDLMVDAAMVGFERGEKITIPPLQNEMHLENLELARKLLLSDIKQTKVADRYQ